MTTIYKNIIDDNANIEVTKSNDVIINITVKDGDDVVIDITGFTIFFTVKLKSTDLEADAYITKDITSHTDPTAGETQIALSDSDTNIAAQVYRYDIKAKDSTGQLLTYVENRKFTIKQDITTRST